MKQLMVAIAVVGLATAGCAQNGMLARSNCRGAGCHVTRSRLAPRPKIVRNACRDSCCACNTGCDCGQTCCSDSCCGNCGQGGSCACRQGSNCGACGGAGCSLCPHSGGYPEPANFNPSPPTGQTAYPYYTVRGPRDFLQANPRSIGPN